MIVKKTPSLVCGHFQSSSILEKAIGWAYPDYSQGFMLGWRPGSIALHCDEGKVYFRENGLLQSFHFFRIRTGETIGTGKTSDGDFYFTHNGCRFPANFHPDIVGGKQMIPCLSWRKGVPLIFFLRRASHAFPHALL